MAECVQQYPSCFDKTKAMEGHHRETMNFVPKTEPIDFSIESLNNGLVRGKLSSVGDPGRHQCEQCGKTFTRAFTLKTHVRVVHTREKPHDCDICGKAFAHKDNMKKHRFIHTGERPYGCDFCDRTFIQRSCMRAHRKMHEREFAGLLVRRHPPILKTPTVETTEDEEPPCYPPMFLNNTPIIMETMTTDKTAETSPLLKTLTVAVKTENEEVQNTTVLVTPHEVKPTLEKKKTQSSKPLKPRCQPKNRICPDCGKVFTRAFTLKSHIRVVHKKEKPFVCDICHKAFAHKDNMKKHRYTHTGEKPYGCTECGKGFTQSSVLNTHLRTHARGKDFACASCERVFKREVMLKRHEVVHESQCD